MDALGAARLPLRRSGASGSRAGRMRREPWNGWRCLSMARPRRQPRPGQARYREPVASNGSRGRCRHPGGSAPRDHVRGRGAPLRALHQPGRMDVIRRPAPLHPHAPPVTCPGAEMSATTDSPGSVAPDRGTGRRTTSPAAASTGTAAETAVKPSHPPAAAPSDHQLPRPAGRRNRAPDPLPDFGARTAETRPRKHRDAPTSSRIPPHIARVRDAAINTLV